MINIPAISRACHLRAIAKPIRLGQEHFDPAGVDQASQLDRSKEVGRAGETTIVI